MKIWHDNSGEDSNASWYLKYIIVYDFQEKEKFYAMSEQWLTVENGDGKIERNLYFISKTEFLKQKYLNERMKEKMSDFHLWYSVFTKPIASKFSRFERVTCCFLFVYLTTALQILYFTNIIYYMRFGSKTLLYMELFDLTTEQVRSVKNSQVMLHFN